MLIWLGEIEFDTPANLFAGVTKEINANDKVDRNRMRANKSMKKARKALKGDEIEFDTPANLFAGVSDT
jgi:hypothetical protein